MEVETHTQAPPPPPPAELIAALEQATLMAKQLPITTDPSHLLQIHTTLHTAHHHLSLFLSNHNPPRGEIGGGDAMELGDDEIEQNSRGISGINVEKVEERMRSCVIVRNKRAKRAISPSAEQRRVYENGGGGGAVEIDSHPVGNKLRALDLIHQFHG